MLAAGFASFFTGVTEPIEFVFMFLAPALYVVHAALTGLSLFIAASFQWTAGFTFSAARELEMSVLGNDSPRCSVAGEVLPTKDFYDYEAKYEDGTTNYAIPAVISPELLKKMEDAAIRAFKVLNGPIIRPKLSIE